MSGELFFLSSLRHDGGIFGGGGSDVGGGGGGGMRWEMEKF
jgi:hypothetical protein